MSDHERFLSVLDTFLYIVDSGHLSASLHEDICGVIVITLGCMMVCDLNAFFSRVLHQINFH